MRKQPMVSHADAKTPGDPPQHHREQECLPSEYEQRSYSTDVKRHHKEGSNPHDGLRKRSVVPKDFRYPHIFTLN